MMSDNIRLQYPVVLVPGNIPFRGGIPEALESRGIQVFLAATDAWGSYETNALLLKMRIENVLLQTKTERVNIIAHSKGGIDSRYLIWKHDFGDKIASLTTVCTPHHGSEIADLMYTIVARKKQAYPRLRKIIDQLTTAKMRKFNQKITTDNKVFYQSLYTTIDDAFGINMFPYTYSYIRKTSGKNDGLVSECSAQWGDNTAKIEGGISHMGILGIEGKTGVNIPGIYVRMAQGLSKRHF
jgi:triacylglycerol lipase